MFSFALALIALALFFGWAALVASSHGPCTGAGTVLNAIQLLAAAASLVAAIVAVIALFRARWRRAAWAAGAQLLLLTLWFLHVFAICPG
jgi:hypothetical protein